MLLLALLLLYHPAKTETYLYNGTCGKLYWPLDDCPEGFNLSVQLTTIGSDNTGRSPFNVPRDFKNNYLIREKCWHLDLECTERFIRVTTSCYCSKLASSLLPLRNASDEEWLSTDTVKWQLHHIDTRLVESPDNSTVVELLGCYDHGNGYFSVGSMFGTDQFVDAPEWENSSDKGDGPNCNYINKMVFPRELAQSNLVCIVVLVALMVSLAGAVLWSMTISRK